MVRRTLIAPVCLVLVLGSRGMGCAALELQLRKPGKRLVTFPGPVAEEYRCDERKLPFFEIEEKELTPERVKPGHRVNYRYTYVMCPAKIAEVVSGKLYTRVHYRGKRLFTDVVESEIQPGRWLVDSFVKIPAVAKPGVYALEAEFRSSTVRFRVHSDFLVVADPAE